MRAPFAEGASTYGTPTMLVSCNEGFASCGRYSDGAPERLSVTGIKLQYC